jgi:hypothetical protein
MEGRAIANSNRAFSNEPEQRSNPPYRPPIGVPLERPGRWGLVVSLAVHALIVFLLVGGVLTLEKAEIARGAGGAGPMGGGGGGRPGLAGRNTQERIRYMRMVAPQPAAPVLRPPITPPVVKKPPVPDVKKPVVQPRVSPTEEVAPPSSAAPTVIAVAPSVGAGTDGTDGAGPGTGGGVGAGNGPGHGSGNGPGTGGGEGTIFPATPDFAVIPPLPVPKGLHGKTVQLRFTIDESGRVVKFDFDPTGDSGYDRELKTRLSEYHFRPAHKQDGTPVRSVFVTEFEL